MKKIFTILLAFVLVISLCSCGEKSQIRKAQDKIVEIGNQFLDYEITADEAVEKLDSIVVPETDRNGSILEATKDALSFSIRMSKHGLATHDKIKETIDHIKSRDYEK